MVLELLGEARQTVVACCNQHFCPIFALFLLQKEPTAFVTRLQDRLYSCLLLLIRPLQVVSQLVWHLA